MTEKQLIEKIKKLRQIKPRENWVFLTKERIFEEEPKEFEVARVRVSGTLSEVVRGIRIIFQPKFAFASLAVLVILMGTFSFAQKSLPGDFLYPIKKITERSQAIFISEKEQPKRSLELANKRLNDLTKIAQNNSVKNLAPAINEYKARVSEAAEKLLVEKEPGKDIDMVREIVLEVKKLEENRQKVEALGIVINDTEELDNALALLIEREIEDLEKRALTESQKEILDEMKEDYENERYFQALERILFLSNNTD